ISDEARRNASLQQLQAIYFQAVGMNMMMQSMQRQLQSPGAANNLQLRSEFDASRGRVIGLREGRAAMESMPFGLDREPFLLAVIQLSDGVFGTIAWIDEQIDVMNKNETYASFDSELSLVAWPRYPLIRWQPNTLHYRYDQSALREFKKTFMVSRLEGPTLKLTREMVDQAIAVEKTGLTGKVYLDARGLAKPGEATQPGSYQDYDQAVLMAADLIQKNTNLEVVLDTKQELFKEGDCPDAALYCGWYSLAKYIDAFDWKPGAVGYHMASAEATVLRDPPNVEAPSQVWCKRMLEDGVVATLGPTYEPYISAFPRPNEFFACLLSGDYTLVEAYYRTLPFTSWTMTLLGDPLYSPFKA
ncbi:MAG: TIGR03790 family protein, partial [Planctomycetales bacterium]|nr:TIGR03790 family protein [Planctomycetales bacterium]